jgi:hypothetical protein
MRQLLIAAATATMFVAGSPAFAASPAEESAQGLAHYSKGGEGYLLHYGYRTRAAWPFWRTYGAYGAAHCLVRNRVDTISGRVIYRWHRVC